MAHIPCLIKNYVNLSAVQTSKFLEIINCVENKVFCIWLNHLVFHLIWYNENAGIEMFSNTWCNV